MRVLLASSSSGSRGGGEFFLTYLGEALAELGVEPALWVSSGDQMDELAEQFASIGPVLRHPYRNTYLRRTRSFSHAFGAPAEMSAIANQWKAFRPDVIHLNKQCLEDGLDLLDTASDMGIPHGCTIHITQTAVELKAFLGGMRDRLARKALRNYPGQLWAISAQRARELQGFTGQDAPVPFIPNGVRIPEMDAISESGAQMRKQLFGDRQPDGPVAVCVGRIEEQKDPFRFLEILGQWKESSPGLTGVWVGDGRLREPFENRIREMGAADWIHCAGWQPDPLPYLSMADVYVHPARFEGLPFALLEAMAHQLPCVISPSLASELEEFPHDTWVIAGEDPSSWLDLVMDSSGMERIGKRSRERIIESFSIQAMARSYMKLYESLMDSWKGQPS